MTGIAPLALPPRTGGPEPAPVRTGALVPLPIPALPDLATDGQRRFSTALLDASGRIQDRGIVTALDWKPGDRLLITQLSSSAVICRRSDGVFRMMDIRMPGVDGLRATELLAGPGVPEPLHAVMVTTFGLDENVHAALRAGACGFLLKDAGPNLLVEAVHAAANGEAMVSSAITARLLEHFARRGPGRAGTPENPLTPRESDVVQAVARGQTNEEICRSLVVSMPTVKTHIGAVIAIWAWESGLVR